MFSRVPRNTCNTSNLPSTSIDRYGQSNNQTRWRSRYHLIVPKDFMTHRRR
jgi:hypothetical protein